MRTTSMLALAVVMAAPAAAQQSTGLSGVSAARDELLADFSAALALKLHHCDYRLVEDDSFQWIALPTTYPKDPYLSKAEERRVATDWVAAEWEADGPFPKRYEWEFQLSREGSVDGRTPHRGVYSWDPESQRLFAGIRFAFPVEFDPGVGREFDSLPRELHGPSYAEDRPRHLPRVVCSPDDCQVFVRPGMDVRTARSLAILEREIPVTLRLELVVEPAAERRHLPRSEHGLSTGDRTTPWGCEMAVGEMRVDAWELSIDGRRYAGS